MKVYHTRFSGRKRFNEINEKFGELLNIKRHRVEKVKFVSDDRRYLKKVFEVYRLENENGIIDLYMDDNTLELYGTPDHNTDDNTIKTVLNGYLTSNNPVEIIRW